MKFTASEKLEVIRLLEDSELSVRRTLRELGIHRFQSASPRRDQFSRSSLMRPPASHWSDGAIHDVAVGIERHRDLGVPEPLLPGPVSPDSVLWQALLP